MNVLDKEKNHIIFLGTGTSTGIPVISCKCATCMSKDIRDKRFRTSAFINYNGFRLVIDCGPDFRLQMINNKIDDIDAILITHGHRDHIAGIDDIRPFNFILGKVIHLYAKDEIMDQLDKEFPYILNPNGYFGSPQISYHPISNDVFYICDQPIIPIPIYHGNLEILGFRFNNLAYITDASMIPESSIQLIKGVDILVINALRRSPHISHLSLPQALEIIKQVNPNKAYLTHLSHFLPPYKQILKDLPPNVIPAYDGLKVTF